MTRGECLGLNSGGLVKVRFIIGTTSCLLLVASRGGVVVSHMETSSARGRVSVIK